MSTHSGRLNFWMSTLLHIMFGELCMSKMLDLMFKMFYVLFLHGKRRRSSKFVVFDVLVAPLHLLNYII